MFDPAFRFRTLHDRALPHLLPSGRRAPGRAAGGHRRRRLADDRQCASAVTPPRADARRPRPINPSWPTAGPRRSPTTRSSSPPRRRPARSSSATPTTGCGWSSPTSSRTSCISIGRRDGPGSFRGMFGRTPLAFPNLWLPTWQIEGLATYEESALTGGGPSARRRLPRHRGAKRRAAGRFEPLDRVNGGLTDWPGGGAVYAFGLGFHAYLAERFGADRLAILANATAGRVPFTASRVFERIFGRSLGALWADYEASLRASAAAPAGRRWRKTADTSRVQRGGTTVCTAGVRHLRRGHPLLGRTRRTSFPRCIGWRATARRRFASPRGISDRRRPVRATSSTSISSSCAGTRDCTAISTRSNAQPETSRD